MLAIVIALLGAARSAAQLAAMEIFATHSDRATLERASHLDPANYRIHVRLAHGGRTRCAHALAAHHLYPSSEAAAGLARGCKGE